jgi:hypothetical protein
MKKVHNYSLMAQLHNIGISVRQCINSYFEIVKIYLYSYIDVYFFIRTLFVIPVC